MHRRGWPEPKLLHTRNTGLERGLYSLDDPHPDVPVDAVEIGLAELVDGPAAAVIPKLADEGPVSLSEDERLDMARFISLQVVRSPAEREQFMRTMRFLHEEVFRDVISAPGAAARLRSKTGDARITEDTLRQLREAMGTGELKIDVHRDRWLAHLMQVMMNFDFHELIANLPWRVVRSTTRDFVVSDNPVVRARVRAQRLGERSAGWLAPSIEATLPLDPRSTLVRADLTDGVGYASDAWVRDVNRRSAAASHAEFYSAVPRPDLLPALQSNLRPAVRHSSVSGSANSRLLSVAEVYVEGMAYR